MVSEPSKILRRLLIRLDLLGIAGTLLVAYVLRASVIRPWFTDDLQPLWTYFVWLAPAAALLWFFLMSFFRGYQAPHRDTYRSAVGAALRTVGVGTVALITFGFFFKLHFISRAFLLIFGALNFLCLVGNRVGIIWYVQRAQRQGVYRRQVLIVGTGNRARKALEMLRVGSDWGIVVTGLLDRDRQRVGRNIDGHKVLGTVADLGTVLKEHAIDEVIVAVPRRWIDEELEEAVRICEAEGVKATLMADFFDVRITRTKLTEIDGVPFLEFPTVPHEDWQVVTKRTLDVLVSTVALALLAPLLMVIATAVKLSSPGPIFFGQDRVGYRKRHFRMLKFRTMVKDAEKLLPGLLAESDSEGPFFKMKADPRITAVGSILRRTSLDELPQLINVLKGDMSLVGPRPVPLVEADRFDRSTQRKRFSVKPGITGLWQISGRSSLSADERITLDLEYIRRWSLVLDLWVVGRTPLAVIRGMGAF
jgi:exopolysaccharide biosynthesis polyprenyl glycosylphosphotransferase